MFNNIRVIFKFAFTLSGALAKHLPTQEQASYHFSYKNKLHGESELDQLSLP
jgi:hypothetical protein